MKVTKLQLQFIKECLFKYQNQAIKSTKFNELQSKILQEEYNKSRKDCLSSV